MTQYTAKAAIPYAELTDAPNMQTYSLGVATLLDGVVIPKYALVASRDAANPTPAAGDLCWCTDTGEIYIYKTSWVGLVPRTAIAGSDTVRTNSATLLDATGLTLPVEANSQYVLESMLVFTGDSANDCKLAIIAPAGATGNMNILGSTGTNDSEFNTSILVGTRALGVAITYDTNVGGVFSARPNGVISVAGTAGNVKIQFAQGTAATSTSATIKAGSYIQLTKVS